MRRFLFCCETIRVPVAAISLVVLTLTGCSRQSDSLIVERMTDSLAALPRLPPSNLTGLPAFERYFQFEDTIPLSDEVLLGGISSMDIGPNGNLLVTDMVSREVVLFAENGQMLKQLSTEPCHPGINWAPLMAKFTPNGKIFVLLDGQPGFYFSGSGVCIERMDDTFWPPRLLDFTSKGNLLGFYIYPPESYIATMNPSGQELTRFGGSKKKIEITNRVRSGGLLTDNQDFVYVLYPFIPHVYKYDLSGQLVRLLGQKPSYYREIDDIGIYESDPMMMEALSEKMDAASISAKIFMLSENVLLVLYINLYNTGTNPDENMGLMIMDTMGNPLIEEEIRTGGAGRLLFAKHGLTYRTTWHTETDGSRTNPILEVYRYSPLTRSDEY